MKKSHLIKLNKEQIKEIKFIPPQKKINKDQIKNFPKFMKLIEILSEIRVLNPKRLSLLFIKQNFKDIYLMIHKDINLGIGLDLENPLTYEEYINEDGFKEYVVYNGDDDCEKIIFFDIDKTHSDENSWEGPVSIPREYEFRGVKFKAYTSSC